MNSITRRAFLTSAVAVSAAAPMLAFGRARLWGQAGKSYSTRAVDLVTSSLVVDMLHQFCYRIDRQDVLHRWLTQPGSYTDADFDPYRRSGINVINFGNGANTYDDAVRLFGQYNGFIDRYPQWLLRVSTVADLDAAKASGRLGFIFGLQNATQFRSPADVPRCYALGQRISQLTYNSANLLGDGAFEARHAGLSELGIAVVGRMNEVGMAVDVAHAGDRTQLDAFTLSKKPVIISHGNCRALDEGHPRCVSDESIRAMAATGGVMGITVIAFMVKPRDPVTVDDYIDHIDYVAKLVGIEHVGVGSDIGLESNDHADPEMFRRFMASADKRYRARGREAVEGLDQPLRFFDITDGLIRRGYTDDHIRLVLGGNWRRVLGQVWGA